MDRVVEIVQISIQKTGRKPQRAWVLTFSLLQISIQKTGRKPQLPHRRGLSD